MAKDFEELVIKMDPICEWKTSGYWLGGNFSRNRIDFASFCNEDTLKLVNVASRERILNEFWIEIQKFVISVKGVIVN